MYDDSPVYMPDGIGVDIAVDGDEEKPGVNVDVDVPGNRNVDRPEFRKDFGNDKRPAQY